MEAERELVINCKTFWKNFLEKKESNLHNFNKVG